MRFLKKMAINPAVLITNFDLRMGHHGFNLQLLESLKHEPGNQPWQTESNHLLSSHWRRTTLLCEARRHEHHARRQPRSVLLPGVFICLFYAKPRFENQAPELLENVPHPGASRGSVTPVAASCRLGWCCPVVHLGINVCRGSCPPEDAN
jgi:hypothetical protein